VGLFAAYQQANAAPTNRYVVATRALAPGEIIDEGDLGLAPADVPTEVSDGLTQRWEDVVGRETLAAVEANSFVSPSQLIEAGTSAGSGRRVALELTRAGAVDGSLRTGSVVDVLSSSDGEPTATVVARRARVVALGDDTGAELGQLASVVVTLELADEKALAAVVGANTSGTVTLAAPTPSTSAAAPEAPADDDPREANVDDSDVKGGGGG
jgi:Flp pilus assembly protein CpaB